MYSVLSIFSKVSVTGMYSIKLGGFQHSEPHLGKNKGGSISDLIMQSFRWVQLKSHQLATKIKREIKQPVVVGL